MRRHHFLTGILIIFITLFFVINVSYEPKNDDHSRIEALLALTTNESLCSTRSARRGANQHILSVSAYESNDNIGLTTSLTWSYMITFINEAEKQYPSWIVRIYHFNLKDKTKNDIEKFEAQHENVDFCDAEQLPVLGNIIHKIPGKIQRFLPAIDLLVDVFIARDLDSTLFDREKHAVDEWLTYSQFAFHIMRDNPQHNIPILGGMWGLVPNRLSTNDRLSIARVLLPNDHPDKNREFFMTYSNRGDQLFLTHYIWPVARRNSLVHDSYSCWWSRYIDRSHTRPFPTQRSHPLCFVGCPKPCCRNNTTPVSDIQQCPPGCRPKEHQDWLFC